MRPSTLRLRLFVSLLFASLLSPLALAGQGAARTKADSSLTASERAAASRVEVKTLREVTEMLASKEMEGRGTGQPGADRAARYIADRFANIGLKPLGDAGTYLQAIKFKSEHALPESAFKAGDTALKFKDDFVVAPPLPAEPKDVTGGLVFVGYGVVSEELKRDDLSGLDLKGKVVFVLRGKPGNADEAAWKKAASEQMVIGRLLAAGAAGAVLIYSSKDAPPYTLLSTYLARRKVALADAPPPFPFKLPPILLVSPSAADKILRGSGLSYAQAKAKAEAGEFVSRDLNKQASISVRLKREEVTSSNVAAVLEGSDSRLKDQAVVYSAHYDAYGIDSDGTIYPGAADNALGVAKLVAIADALARSKIRPRRSIIFLAVTGEEYGLLGAKYWVKNPTWPIEKVAANINYDGIGHDVWGPMKLLIDYGFKHSDLNTVIAGVAAATNIEIIPDPMPEENVFYRSDHYAFFVRGIPSLYLIGVPAGNPEAMLERTKKWLVTDYHMATDTVQKDWNWEGARTLTIVGLVAGMRVADRDRMPAWSPASPYNRPRGTYQQ
jgi:Zn-dependent M28 family amino/carboxypeptidase